MIVEDGFLDAVYVAKALGLSAWPVLSDMPEDLRKLTPDLRILGFVLIPLQRDLRQIREAYEARGVILEFTDEFLKRRKEASLSAKRMGLDDKPYVVKHFCPRKSCRDKHAEWLGQFGDIPIYSRCNHTASRKELGKIVAFEKVITKCMAENIPRSHGLHIEGVIMELPWHAPEGQYSESEMRPDYWEGSQKTGTGLISLIFGRRVSLKTAQTTFLHEVGHIFTIGNGVKIIKGATYPLNQELAGFNVYAWKKTCMRGNPVARSATEILADAYALFATGDLPKRRFPRLYEYIHELYRKKMTSDEIAEDHKIAGAYFEKLSAEQEKWEEEREEKRKRQLVAAMAIKVFEETRGRRWTLRFQRKETHRLFGERSVDELGERFAKLAAVKLGVYPRYIDCYIEDYDDESDEYVVTVEAKEGFDEAKAVFERESRCETSI
jgi:hypothetical protein